MNQNRKRRLARHLALLLLVSALPVSALAAKPPADPDAACLAKPSIDCLFIAAYHAAANVPESERRAAVVDILGQQLVAGYAAVPREVVDQAALSDAELKQIMEAQLAAGDGGGALASIARMVDPAQKAAAYAVAGSALLKRGDKANATAALQALAAAPTAETAGDGAVLAAGLGDAALADTLLDLVTERGRAEEARHGVARRLAEQDKLDQALDMAGDIRFTPGRDATLAAIADIRAGKNDLDGAIAALEDVKDPALASSERARLIPALIAAGRFDEAKELIAQLETSRQQAALTRWAAAAAKAGNADAANLLETRADAPLQLRNPAERFEAALPLVGAYGRLEQRDRALALGALALNAAKALPPADSARAIRRLFAEQAESGERIGLEATLKALAAIDDDPVATLMAEIEAGLTLAKAGDTPGGNALLTAAGTLVERLPLTDRALVLARLSAARLAVGDQAGAKAALLKGVSHLDALRMGEQKAVATVKLAQAAAALSETAASTLAATAATAAASSNWPARNRILGESLPVLLDRGALDQLMTLYAALPADDRLRVLPLILQLLRQESEAKRTTGALSAAKRLTDPADYAAALTVLVVTETRAGRTTGAAKLIAARSNPAEKAALLSAMAVALSGR